MTDAARTRFILACLFAVGFASFFAGIQWGLPSKSVDPYLFGDHPVWTGREIVALLPNSTDPNRGADVDANPIVNRLHPILLNETDQQRAEIIRRYRLFTYQPDEMITMMSLARMKPAQLDLDPLLYQYGGLWIYPIGALLKVASVFHFIDLRSDVAFYLDHPEAFGKFYVVARAYSALWGIVGTGCVFWIARRVSGNLIPAIAAASCFCCMPVVINMAHEAKPHLPGAVLMLLAIMAATRFVETGQTKWWLWTSMACGAAFGMVLSGALCLILLPAMTLLRKMTWNQRMKLSAQAIALSLAVYLISNPYVAINSMFHRDRLASNLSNSTAMYRATAGASTLTNAIELIGAGTSPLLAIAGAVGVSIFWRVALRRDRERKPDLDGAKPLICLLMLLACVIAMQFILLASGKPGEYGRFAILPDIALMIAATSLGSLARGVNSRIAVATLLVLVTLPFGAVYWRAFWLDSQPISSRLRAAEELQHMPGSIGLFAEPAPYSCPPIDLFARQLILLPPDFDDQSPLAHRKPNDAPVDFTLHVRESPQFKASWLEIGATGGTPWLPWRLSWANKSFEVRPARGFLGDTSTQKALAAADLR